MHVSKIKSDGKPCSQVISFIDDHTHQVNKLDNYPSSNIYFTRHGP